MATYLFSSGDLRRLSGPGAVLILISCHETPTPSNMYSVNADPTTKCGSRLDFDISKVVCAVNIGQAAALHL